MAIIWPRYLVGFYLILCMKLVRSCSRKEVAGQCHWHRSTVLWLTVASKQWRDETAIKQAGATSTLFMTRLFGFMWTPSKAPILSRPPLRSLSLYNLLQNTSLSFLPVLLFPWTAKAKSWGEPALPLKMTPVPLHFLPRHCVLHGLYRGNHCVAFDLASYSTWIWWWLFHDWNINSILPSLVYIEARQRAVNT